MYNIDLMMEKIKSLDEKGLDFVFERVEECFTFLDIIRFIDVMKEEGIDTTKIEEDYSLLVSEFKKLNVEKKRRLVIRCWDDMDVYMMPYIELYENINK